MMFIVSGIGLITVVLFLYANNITHRSRRKRDAETIEQIKALIKMNERIAKALEKK